GFKNKLQNTLEQLKKSTSSEEKKPLIYAVKKMLQERIKKKKIYATKKIGNSNYFSLIEDKNGCIVVNSLQINTSLSTNLSVFEYDDVMGLSATPPVVFLQLSYRGTIIGDLHISLDGRPGHAQQFLELCTGSSGRGSYRGARFDYIGNKSRLWEAVYCEGFIDTAGATEIAAIRQVEYDWTVRTPVTEGVVFGVGGQNADFMIVTNITSNSKGSPVIGHVTSGLPDLQAAVARYTDGDIEFSETGLIIDASV
ncbi:unnamed protein product, partial [Meganyctiphanes norvegica]